MIYTLQGVTLSPTPTVWSLWSLMRHPKERLYKNHSLLKSISQFEYCELFAYFCSIYISAVLILTSALHSWRWSKRCPQWLGARLTRRRHVETDRHKLMALRRRRCFQLVWLWSSWIPSSRWWPLYPSPPAQWGLDESSFRLVFETPPLRHRGPFKEQIIGEAREVWQKGTIFPRFFSRHPSLVEEFDILVMN